MIDAWWDGAKTTRIETAALERLHSELIELEFQLGKTQNDHTKSRDIAYRLIGFFDDEPYSSVAADSLARMINFVSTPWTLDAPNSVFRSIEASGLAASLQNQEIVENLSNWQALFDDLISDEKLMAVRVESELRPYLLAKIAIRSHTPRLDSPSQFSSDYSEMFADREFENHIVTRWRAESLMVDDYEGVRSDLQELITMISNEIETR